MSMKELMAAGNSLGGGVTPEGVSFDGTSDGLGRSSDLTGNADGKTFTFSAWVYRAADAKGTLYTSENAAFHVLLDTGGNNIFNITAENSSGTTIFNMKVNTNLAHTPPLNQWAHILISVDLANTSNRYVYIDDLAYTPTYITYTNDLIDFTVSKHGIASYINTLSGAFDYAAFIGRLAHVYLDYTYRDLSVESNRRLFIDADGKPSSTIPSSPILYLPMTDAATAGSNSGTGGDFTVNGVLDTAGRGPNQWNCSASEFDGSADYLSRSSIAGISDGKEFTFSCAFRGDTLDNKPFISIEGGGNQYFFIRVSNGGSYKYLTMGAYNTSTTYILHYNATDIKMYNGVNYSLQISIDMTDEAKSKVVVNGEVKTLSAFTAFSNENIDFTHSNYGIGAVPFPNHYFNGSIGELYFDDSYTDLSADNPFWDADANRPKPVRQVISETGTTPLIALPLRGEDAGNNLGTGGDFTVNSGPYTGARGGSEFWARSAEFNGSNQYLDRAALTGASDGRVFSLAFSALKDTTSNMDVFGFHPSGGYGVDRMNVVLNTGNVRVIIYDSGGTIRYDFSSTFTHGAGVWNTYLISGNVDTSGAAKISVNGNSLTLSENTRTPTDLNFSAFPNIGRTAYNYFNGKIGFLWFNTEYIDFSQESNRNLFVDQLGYPKDLTPAIDAGDIAEPLIYMKFDDTSDLGANSGTGGDFTVNGTVTAGADVDPNA